MSGDSWKNREFLPGSEIERVLGVDRFGTHRSGRPIKEVIPPPQPDDNDRPQIFMRWDPELRCYVRVTDPNDPTPKAKDPPSTPTEQG